MKYGDLVSRLAVLKRIRFLGLLAFAFSLQAADSLEPPQQVLQVTAEKLKSKLQTEEMKNDVGKTREFVQGVLEPHVDFNQFSKIVLGKHWRRANNEQRERFTKEFKTLLIRTYATAFHEYSDWTIRYLPLKPTKREDRVIAPTEVLQPGATPVAISYRMINKDNEWMVYDIIIEGISLAINYKTSFKNEISRTGSLDAVIDRLAARNNEGLNKASEGS